MTAKPKHPCARCGKAQPIEKLIYSGWSKLRYCADLTGCDARAKRAGRPKVKTVRELREEAA